MAESVIKNYFPSQVVSDLEKMSFEYGLKVAKAIEHEWFDEDQSLHKYHPQFQSSSGLCNILNRMRDAF